MVNPVKIKALPHIYQSLIALILIMLLPSIVLAHPPKGLTAQYDMAAQSLTIVIDHNSFASSMHYIGQVEVKKNGKTVLTHEYKNQPDKNPFEYKYNIPASEGDTLEIKATCNIYGSKTIEIKVGGTKK